MLLVQYVQLVFDGHNTSYGSNCKRKFVSYFVIYGYLWYSRGNNYSLISKCVQLDLHIKMSLHSYLSLQTNTALMYKMSKSA